MNKILYTVCILTTFFSFSQQQELEDISVEMLQSTHSEIDSTAAAEVLYEKGEITFKITPSGIKYVLETTRRIKIYNKDGYDEANIEIPYYVGESSNAREKLKSIKAYTYYLEDEKIEDEKVRNRDIYDIELSEVVAAKKFTFPKIQDGVIIEYNYIKESPHIGNLPRWMFQSTIPTVYSEFEVIIPDEYLTYRTQYRGFYDIETSTKNYDSMLKGVGGGQQFFTKQNTHYADSLQAFEGENHVNNISNYISSISYELSSFRKGDVGDVEYLSRTWEDVINSLRESETFSKELHETKYFEEDLALALEGATSDIDKINMILDFVKNKIKWNKKNRRYCSDELKKVYAKGIGNSADINIMLTAMLRAYDFDAHPVFSSTISNGIPFFPTVSGFNYVITGVTLGEQYFLLDATDEYSSLNIIPTRTMNWEGIELSPNGSRTVQLIPQKKSKVNFNVLAKIEQNGKLTGQCRVYYFDQFALNARNAFSNSSTDDVKAAYEKEYNLNNVHDFKQTNLDKLDKPLVQSFEFDETEGFVEKIGDKLYLSPLVFLKAENNPFKSEERNYPVEFTYPKTYTYRLFLDLPEGYEVDYIPEQNIFKMADGMMSFTYMINEDNGKLVVDVTKDIASAIIPASFYSNLREYYISMLDKENDKVVLKKS